MTRKNRLWIFICLPLLFILYWFLYNRRYVKVNEVASFDKLKIMNSDSIGYFSFIIIGTLFTYIFLFFINYTLHKIIDYELIRYGKKRFFKSCFVQIASNTMCFAFLFETINVILNYIYFSVSILNSMNFIIMSCLHFILLFVYFLLVGYVFLMVCTFNNFHNYSVWITGIIFSTFVGISIVTNVEHLPVTDFCILDDWFNGEFLLYDYIRSILKNGVIIILLYLISKNNFMTTDFLKRGSKSTAK